MGFIPIILTVSAAIILFIMAVHNSMKSKKSQIEGLQLSMEEGIKTLIKDLSNFKLEDPKKLSETFQLAKNALEEDQKEDFHVKVRMPYQKIKLIKAQYNKLISRKPYSFVAKMMGHEPI
ncbi:MAG: hypothetical protein ACXIUQ_00300 [Cecembia sp.]